MFVRNQYGIWELIWRGGENGGRKHGAHLATTKPGAAPPRTASYQPCKKSVFQRATNLIFTTTTTRSPRRRVPRWRIGMVGFLPSGGYVIMIRQIVLLSVAILTWINRMSSLQTGSKYQNVIRLKIHNLLAHYKIEPHENLCLFSNSSIVSSTMPRTRN